MSETPIEVPAEEGTDSAGEVLPEPPVAEPEPEYVPPQQTTSELLKIRRAVTGDDMWGERLSMAFILGNKPDTPTNRILATQKCVDKISCDINGTVNTEGVPDDSLMAAVAELPDPPNVGETP